MTLNELVASLQAEAWFHGENSDLQLSYMTNSPGAEGRIIGAQVYTNDEEAVLYLSLEGDNFD